ALDPQPAEIALTVAPVAVGVTQRLFDLFQRDPINGAIAATITPGQFQHLFVPGMGGDAAFDPGHRLSLAYRACRSAPACCRPFPSSSCRAAAAYPASTC